MGRGNEGKSTRYNNTMTTELRPKRRWHLNFHSAYEP